MTGNRMLLGATKRADVGQPDIFEELQQTRAQIKEALKKRMILVRLMEDHQRKMQNLGLL